MNDMLVRLTNLPSIRDLEEQLNQKGIIFRNPVAPEKELMVKWVATNFSDYWGSEMDVAFSCHPVNCYLAQEEGQPIGFACYETTAKNFFGPTGVLEKHRGLGIGKVLLVKSLESLRAMGYAYAIIGGVGPAAYYEKTVNAVLIESSEHSIYSNLLKKR